MILTAERRVAVPLTARRSSSTSGLNVSRMRGETMGTTWSVVFAMRQSSGLEELRAALEQTLSNIVAQMSAWEPQSDLTRFNCAEAGTVHALPAELFNVLDYALSLAAATEGAYDPTIGSLVALWGFGPEGTAYDIPNESAIATAKAACGWRRLILSRVQRTATQPGCMCLDVCAVAKGYAVDCLAEVMRAFDCRDFLIEIGGELRGEGCKPDGSPWWVAVEPPRSCGNDAGSETLIALHGLAVATSGDNRRYFEQGGRRYAHTIDPRNGSPTDNRVVSVTVLASSCMEADALSTALMVLGEDDAIAFAEARDIAAMFVIREESGLRQRLSPAFTAMVE